MHYWIDTFKIEDIKLLTIYFFYFEEWKFKIELKPYKISRKEFLKFKDLSYIFFYYRKIYIYLNGGILWMYKRNNFIYFKKFQFIIFSLSSFFFYFTIY